MIDVNKKKEEEKKLKHEIETNRKEMIEKEKLEQEKEKIKMREKLESYVKSISEQKDLISTSTQNEIIDNPNQNGEIVKDIDINVGAKINPEIKAPTEDTGFTTFTSLGLKRKKLDDENLES